MITKEWIAGFFDGEGNVNKIIVKKHPHWQLRIYQNGDNGLKILTDIKSFLGMGKIYSRLGRKENHKEAHELYITGKQNVKKFKDEIGIYCQIKKFPSDEELIDLKGT